MANDENKTAGERATESLEDAKGNKQTSQAENEQKSRDDLVPVTELGIAPSKSTGQLVPDTQTGVMAAQSVEPETGKSAGTVKVTLEGTAAADDEKTEFEFEVAAGGDLTDTFNAVAAKLTDLADTKARKVNQTTAHAMANTTGVTQDNFENTPEAKGRPSEVFLTDADALAAEVAAQNAKREGKSDKQAKTEAKDAPKPSEKVVVKTEKKG